MQGIPFKTGQTGLIIFVLTLLSWLEIRAQDSITPAPPPTTVKVKIDSTQVRFFNLTFDSLFLGYYHYLDTNLLLMSRFDPLSQQSQLMQTLSNAGLAHQAMDYKPVFHGGFDMNRHAYSAYLFDRSKTSFTDPTAAITEINYMMGSKKEQQLTVLFGRQVAPRLYVGMDFQLIDSKGPYKNSGTSNTNAYFTARYNTKNQRYGVLAYYLNNKINAAENGGITADSVFEKNLEFDRRVIGVNLETAKNKYKLSGFGFEHYFILLPERKQTTDSTTEKRRFQLGRLTHQFEYQRNQSIYSETQPLAAFYQPFDPVLDSAKTYDSTYQEVIRNKFYWSSLGYKKHEKNVPFHLYGGVELNMSSFSDSTFKKRLWQVNPFGGINISLFRSFYVNGTARLITGSESSGDLELFGRVKQYLGTESRNLGNLFFSARLINQSPSWFFERYQSNHFRWHQQWGKSTYLTLAGGYQLKGFHAGIDFNLLDKHIFLNSDARPQQISGSISVMKVYTNLHLKPGKFDLLANLSYQVSDNDSIISLPAISGRIRLAFSQVLIRDVAVLQPGVEAMWFSEYYADAWMPALGAFYTQREKKIGNYPFVDVYLALKVKRARIYVQYANLFGLAGQYNYYTTPHYPMRDARFYFGVSWRFYQ